MATPQPITPFASSAPPPGGRNRGTQEYCHALVMLWARLESLVRLRGRQALRDVRGTSEFEALHAELRLLASAPQSLLPSVRLAAGEQLRLAALAGSVASQIERGDADAPCRVVLECAQDDVWDEIVDADAVDWIETIVAAACRPHPGAARHGRASSRIP